MILALLACGAPATEDTGKEDPAPRDTDSGGPDTADTGTTSPSDLDTVLAELRADRDGALLRHSRAAGWPLSVEDGVLFVYPATGGWRVAGDFDDWAGQPMEEEDDFSWLVVSAAEGGYKFTRDDVWNPDPWARRLRYDEFGELSLVTADGAHLERQFEVGNTELEARTLHIFVPEAAPTRVLYMHDGQNLFNPEAIWGGWHVQDVAPDDVLIVGIANTDARMEEYTHVEDWYEGVFYGGWGDTYADYLQDTVRPLVAEIYGEPPIVGTLGSSLGGLVSMHIADRYPDDYAFAGSMSGTLGWGSITLHNETMIERYAGHGHQGFAVYLDSGGAGSTCTDSDGDGINDDDLESDDNYCETLQMRDTLAGLGWAYEVDLWHWWEPDAEHDEVAWAARVSMPLEIFDAL